MYDLLSMSMSISKRNDLFSFFKHIYLNHIHNFIDKNVASFPICYIMNKDIWFVYRICAKKKHFKSQIRVTIGTDTGNLSLRYHFLEGKTPTKQV